MSPIRVMPVLLLKGYGLVKTVKFRNPTYIGDPINAVKIFNEKEVDELVFLDISATPEGRGPNYELLADIAGEAFMPMAYGGGLTNVEEVRRIFSLGFEKVVISTASYSNLNLISEVSSIFGAQSIVGCIDIRRNLLGHYVLCSTSAQKRERSQLRDHLAALVQAGVGEIMINSIDRDGTMSGYDLSLLQMVSQEVSVPVIACGGAGSINHFIEAVEKAHVSAVAAGSMFVFFGPHRAVMINYPDRQALTDLLL